MDAVSQWLEPFRAYLSVDAFLAAMSPEAAPREADDADSFFKGLLSPLDDMDLATHAWTRFFMQEHALDGITATPEGARDFVLERLRTASELTPGHAAPLAEANFKLRDYPRSEIATAVAYLLGARDETVLALLMGMGIREQRTEAVPQVLAEAERFHPGSTEIAFCRAIADVSAEHFDRAVATLDAVVEKAPEHKPAWTLLVDVLLSTGANDQALRTATRATALHRDDPLLWGRLARACRKTGALERAADAMARAQQCLSKTVARSEDVTLRLRLESAEIAAELGRTPEALGIYRTLIEEGMRSPAVYANAASCLLTAGQRDEAIRWLTDGLQAQPDDPDLLSNLGEVLFETGADERAFALLQRAAELEPSRTGNLVLMAAICLRNRKFSEAAELAAGVAQADPSRAVEALVLLGDTYRFQGHREPALAAYERAAELAPESDAVRERIRLSTKKLSDAVKSGPDLSDKKGKEPRPGKERR